MGEIVPVPASSCQLPAVGPSESYQPFSWKPEAGSWELEAGSLPRSKSLFVAKAEAGTIPRLVFITAAEIVGVAGVSLFELALTFEVPLVAERLVFFTRLPSFRQAALIAALIGPRLSVAGRTDGEIDRLLGIQEFAKGEDPVAIDVDGVEGSALVPPFFRRQPAVSVAVCAIERRDHFFVALILLGICRGIVRQPEPDFPAAQLPVAVGVELAERCGAAAPLPLRDDPVVVRIEGAKSVLLALRALDRPRALRVLLLLQPPRLALREP